MCPSVCGELLGISSYAWLFLLPILGSFCGIEAVLRLSLLLCLQTTVSSALPASMVSDSCIITHCEIILETRRFYPWESGFQPECLSPDKKRSLYKTLWPEIKWHGVSCRYFMTQQPSPHHTHTCHEQGNCQLRV